MANLLLLGDGRTDERRADWTHQSFVVSTGRPTLKPPSALRHGWQNGSEQGLFSRMSSRSHWCRTPRSVELGELRLHR